MGSNKEEQMLVPGQMESIQGETHGSQHPGHKVFDDGIGDKGALVQQGECGLGGEGGQPCHSELKSDRR